MRGHVCTQIKSLLKKDFTIRRRAWFSTLFELCFPILIIYRANEFTRKALGYNHEPIKSSQYQLESIRPIGSWRRIIKDRFPSVCLYTPESPLISELIDYFGPKAPKMQLIYAPSEEDMLDMAENKSIVGVDKRFVHGLVFDYLQPALNFTVRTPNVHLGVDESIKYREVYNEWDEFITLHWAITSFELKDNPDIEPYLSAQPQYGDMEMFLWEHRMKEMVKEMMSKTPSLILRGILALANLMVLTLAVKRIVTEKQKGSKELLRLMGVGECVFWLSKLLNHLWIFLIQVPIATTLLLDTYGQSVEEKISTSIFSAMVLVFFISNLLLSFILTTVLNKPIHAVIAVILMIFSGLKNTYESSFNYVKIFLYPVDFFGAWLASYSNKPPLPFPVPFLIAPFWIIYMMILVYLDAVCPWQPGSVKPFNFPCKSSGTQTDFEKIESDMDCDPRLVEKTSGEASIVCSKVYKVYTRFGARKTAVENLSVKINKNQITVLLGHNGAGKTTLMNMITGFTSPTSGVVYLNRFNVQKDTLAARRSTALCPQHECLYENLTVEENFALCANLRGTDLGIVPKTIELLKLGEKSSILASKLSGGMRRRVQLGMALATDSNIMILDEPTSGLDPETRRTVWDYLIQLRNQKTILITTHFMEEAEALADQIIIMSAGRIKCIGSQIFLKTKLGAGYSVKMAKKSFNHDATASLIAQFYPKAVLVSDTSEEITFSLGIDEVDEQSDTFLNKIAEFCDSLETKKEELGISSYTITTATLEDVFMKIAVDEGLVAEDRVAFSQIKDTTLAELREALDFKSEKRSGSFFSCYLGLVLKRWHYFRRDYGFMLYSFVFPIVVIIFTSIGTRLLPENFLKTHNFSIFAFSPESSVHEEQKNSIILSASSNSSLAECFIDINSQYNVNMIITNQTIEEYLKSGEKQASLAYLFGVEDQGTEEDIILYGLRSHKISKPIVVNNYLNILRCVGTGNKTLIDSKEQPFPLRPSVSDLLEKSFLGRIMLLSMFPVAFGFLFASAYTFPAKENQMKAELIQRMAGLGDFSYWLSNISFDMIYFMIVCQVILAIVIIANFEILFSLEVIASCMILFFVSFLAAIPSVYLLTFSKVNPVTGFNIICTVTIILGFIGSLLVMFHEQNRKEYLKFALVYKHLPSVSIVAGLYRILWVSVIMYVCDDMRDEIEKKAKTIDENMRRFCLDGEKPNYLKMIEPELKFMSRMALVYFISLIVMSLFGHKLYRVIICIMRFITPGPKKTEPTDDEDVKREKESVASIIKDKTQAQEALVASRLTKDYFAICSRFRAVYDVSFTVHKKECFGLLGVNGAGKTTTFSMLTGDEPMTKGAAYVGNLHVAGNLTKYRENISYCPQQDALLDLLTPEETLRLFARLRGIPGKDIPKNVDYIIFTTDLTKFRKTLNCNLSGGNKRKLGLAIATVGGPAVMFLDEPTTGVDPASRRKIWATLVGLRESGRSSIVLTSHSMDECEALCNRIAIMAKGQMRCLGSSTHLKSKYGQGFTLIIKLKEESAFPSLQECVQSLFPSAKLQDQHGTNVQFHLTDPNLRWGDMFRCMKQVKEKCPIDNFYINDTSIEQIFLSFAHEESPDAQ